MDNTKTACDFEQLVGAFTSREPQIYRCAQHLGARILVAESTVDTPRRISGIVFEHGHHSRQGELECRMVVDEQDYRDQAAG